MANILLVDDDKMITHFGKKVLEEVGHDVVSQVASANGVALYHAQHVLDVASRYARRRRPVHRTSLGKAG